MTVLEHLLSVIHHSGIYNRHDLAKPNVILWTDGERLWEKSARMISHSQPGFFQLDESEVGDFSGPSTWVRYQLGKWTGDNVPVVYLPGIHRHQFRGAAGFPEYARHLYALQFQGQFCSQLNGKDWTPAAILGSEDGGLGLRVARDRATQQALGDQLEAVLQTPVAELRGKQLEASDFHELAIGDPVRLVLDWMNAPEKATKDWPESQLAAFLAFCKKDLGFHPEKDGIITAAEKMTSGDGKWTKVWNRFEELALSLPGVRQSLDLVKPADLFSNSNPRIPATNRRLEDELRKGLGEVGTLPEAKAKEALLALAKVHSPRAGTLFARLGEAPLAKAITHLDRMVAGMKNGVAGTDCASIGESYLEGAWVVDAEARRAWDAARKSEDAAAVATALRATYLPWLESLATRLQACAAAYPIKKSQDAREQVIEPGTVILFVDGLRVDLAKELIETMTTDDLKIESAPAWSAMPSVTATAKPAWQPLAAALHGHAASEVFEPIVAATGKPCGTTEFRKLLKECGLTWVDPSQAGNPEQCGWTEVGAFDRYGHDQGAKLAWRIHEELLGVRQRIEELLQAGWKSVRVVTDHGWLWMPGGLPKVDLPKHLTVSKWGRCALPDPQASHELPMVPWFWGNEHPIVLAPGISVFKNGTEYTHGGMTLQEALTLTIHFSREQVSGGAPASITSSKWSGFRLKIGIDPADPTVRADIREKVADPSSSIFKGEKPEKEKQKAPDADGTLTLFVEDDSSVGKAAFLVILRNGIVLAKKSITIGED